LRLISCTYEENGCAILEIFNEAIANSTAIYDYRPRSPESMIDWFQAKEAGRFPVLGAVDDSGQLQGFATYGAFRRWPAYKYSIEHSVYIHKDHRGKGLGLSLMQSLIAAAKQQQYHNMVAGIDVTNTASIALHEKLGFVHAGTIRHAGFKFGRWLDLAFYQLLLETPAEPSES
jgi:phosphinothricin acetyltransferase